MNNNLTGLIFRRTEEDGKIYSDYTMLTVACDANNMRYYYKTYSDQTLRMVDLSSFDFKAKSIKKINAKNEQPIVDVSAALK